MVIAGLLCFATALMMITNISTGAIAVSTLRVAVNDHRDRIGVVVFCEKKGDKKSSGKN
jgi:hypothetical protein